MALPGNGTILATSKEREALYRAAAKQIIRLIEMDLKPRDIATLEAFDNALALDVAMGGSTNTILHTLAVAREAGIEYNNRAYKTFSPAAIYWYKYHRHYKCPVDVFSQSYEDMDITLRRLAQNYFVVKKSLLPRFVVCKRIRRKVGIDENTHQIIDHYYFGLPILDTQWIYAPPLWKLFNSFSRKELPPKEWSMW